MRLLLLTKSSSEVLELGGKLRVPAHLITTVPNITLQHEGFSSFVFKNIITVCGYFENGRCGSYSVVNRTWSYDLDYGFLPERTNPGSGFINETHFWVTGGAATSFQTSTSFITENG